MQQTFPLPLSGRQRDQIPVRYAAMAALISILLAMSAVGIFVGGSGSDDPVRLPAAMQVSPEAPQCDSSAGSLDTLTLTGPTSHESVVMLPPAGPIEGGPGIEATSLPTLGEPADDATIEAVTRTVDGLVACMNAGEAKGTIAWTTDDYWRRSNEIGIEVSPERARSFVPLVGPVEGETPSPVIENVIVLPDGRVSAVIRPGFVAPSYAYDYYVFVEHDGRWLIDEAVHVTEWAIVEIVVTDEGFSSNEIVAPFAPARLLVRNEGTAPHSVVIPELGMRIEVAPGETGPSEPWMGNIKHPPGRFDFHSDIPEDNPDVFSGTLVIEGEVQAPPVSTPSPAPSLDALGVPVASTTIVMRPPKAYEPNRVAILANRDVEITLVNDLEFPPGEPGLMTPVANDATLSYPANITIDELGISVDLDVGESQTIIVNAPAGVYTFYSTIPGHTEVGMTGTLHVVENGTPVP